MTYGRGHLAGLSSPSGLPEVGNQAGAGVLPMCCHGVAAWPPVTPEEDRGCCGSGSHIAGRGFLLQHDPEQ